MTFTVLLMFALTEFLLSLSPGPAVLCVVSQGMRYGSKASIRGALGILIGNTIYFGLSALGIGALILASNTLYMTIKWAGAAYLVYLGLKMIISATELTPTRLEEATPPSGKRLFSQGLITQLANPKAIVYFTALIPQFINLENSLPKQLLILGCVSVTIELPILLLYGWLSAKGRQLLCQARKQAWLDRIAGTFLVGAGIKLALIRRS